MQRLFHCTACSLLKRKDCRKPPQAYGAFNQLAILPRILQHGAWTPCSACVQQAEKQRQKHDLIPLVEFEKDADEDGARADPRGRITCERREEARPWASTPKKCDTTFRGRDGEALERSATCARASGSASDATRGRCSASSGASTLPLKHASPWNAASATKTSRQRSSPRPTRTISSATRRM